MRSGRVQLWEEQSVMVPVAGRRVCPFFETLFLDAVVSKE